MGGCQLRNEISGCSLQFQRWLAGAIRSGFALNIEDGQVDEVAKALEAAGSCVSDDEHVVALAKVTGARLIFTNDRALQADCKGLLARISHQGP